LNALPADYSKLPSPPNVLELGPPLPGDLGPAIVNPQQPVVAAYSEPRLTTPTMLCARKQKLRRPHPCSFVPANQGQAATASTQASNSLGMGGINTLAAFSLDALMWLPVFKTATLHHSLNER